MTAAAGLALVCATPADVTATVRRLVQNPDEIPLMTMLARRHPELRLVLDRGEP